MRIVIQCEKDNVARELGAKFHDKAKSMGLMLDNIAHTGNYVYIYYVDKNENY